MTPWEDHQGRRGWTGVLAVSLVLNGWLLALFGSGRPIEPARDPGPAEAPSDPVTVAPVVPGESTVPTAFKWTELVAEELGEYAENLRALGCPEHVVRGVMADEIRSRYLPLIRQLRRVSVEEHWERDAGVNSANQRERTPETMAAEARLNDLYREYMGRQREFGIRDERSGRDRFPDFDRDDLSLNFLSEEKQARLRQDEEAVDQLRLQLRMEGVPEDEVRQRVAELEAAHARGRQEFLEPAEYERFTEALAEVQAEAEQAVRARLGDEVFGVYARRADWLKAPDESGVGP